MKYAKTLGPLAVAAAALMAFAGTATATTVTSPSGTLYTSKIAATAGTVEFIGSFSTVKCNKSSIEGSVATHGASSTTTLNLTWLGFFECNYAITVDEVRGATIHATGGGNGWLTMEKGTETTIHTSVGECAFTSNETAIGTLKGGSPAKLEIASAAIPRTGGSFLCGSSAKWSGTYTFNTPSSLFLD